MSLTFEKIRIFKVILNVTDATGNFKIPKSIKHIPQFQKFWQQFCLLKYTEDTFKNKLLNELITECNISHSQLLLHRYGKQALIRLNFGALQKHGLVLNSNRIAENLLSYLEPFPFDNEKLENIKPNVLCIGKIRNIIEVEYLMWKYQVDKMMIEELLFKFRYCLYPFRSIRNLRKNISLLELSSEIQERSLAEVIYLINQKPLSRSTLENFEKEVVGINWRMFPHHCFRILRHSHQYIVFVVSLLQTLDFTDTQIRAGLSVLYLPFKTVAFRLNNLLKNPEISKYRNEEFFLYLLYFSSHELLKLVNISFSELIEIARISMKHRTDLLSLNAVRNIVSQFFEIKSSYFNMISNHSKYKMISESQIYDTLSFLKENNFTSEEVAESITIIFYPRNLIEKTLRKIKEKKSSLKKVGFNDECASEETSFFANGTKEKRKTLQLCLYYMEKSFYISGDEMTEIESTVTKSEADMTAKEN